MSLDSRHDMLNDIPVLLPQGGDSGQDSFRKNGAVIALVAAASLPPQSPQTGPRRHQFPAHLDPVDRAGLITVPDGKEPFYLPESPGSRQTGPGLPPGERLKIFSSGAPSRVDAGYR
jgi:hypothetical protein